MELKKTFVGGLMNKDYDVRLIPEGEYIDAENIIVSNSEGSSLGLVQKSNGLDKLTNLNLPLNAVTIGSITDEGNECIYWFVTSSAGNFVYEYNILDNESLSIILSDTRTGSANVLNFNSKYKITGANVIYNSFNKEKLLVWTDDLNPIRCINVNRAKSWSVNGFATQDISLYKRAPFRAPKCTPTQFGDGTENNIKERFLSFGYRYRYLDGEYSATSAFSNPQFYPSDFSFNFSTQENNGMVNSFNAINIGFNTGDKNVTDIQLLFKESNSGTIYVIENFNKEKEKYGNNAEKTFLFSNNKIYSILPEDEVNRLYDNIPVVAKAQEFIGNRLMFGNYTEGRDLVDISGKKINVDFKTSFVAKDLKENLLNTTVSSDETTDNVLNIQLATSDLEKGKILAISFRASSDSPFFGNYMCDLSFYLEKTYASAFELSQSEEFITFLTTVASTNFKNADLNNTEPNNDIESYPDKYKPFVLLNATSSNVLSLKIPYIRHKIDSTPNDTGDSLFTYQNEYYHIKADSVNVFSSDDNVYASCKSIRSYETGIVYLDEEGRYSTVLTSKDNNIFIPIKNSVTSNNLKLEIKSKAPSWANRYKIFVKDSKLDYHTIYSVIAYEEQGFIWLKLEGQDKQKVKEGDYLIVKKNVNGFADDVVKLQILDYATNVRDFIKDNKNPAGVDIIEPSGVYVKVKSSSDLTIDGAEKNFYEFKKESMDTGDNFFVFAGGLAGFSVNKGTLSLPVVEDIPIPPGSRIEIEIKNTRSGLTTVEFKKEYVASDSYNNFQTWFQTEGDGLGNFDKYEFVRGFTKPYDTGTGTLGTKLPNRGETITLNPNGYLYLKIKNELNGNGQNRSFLNARITITTGYSLLIFETDSIDNTSEVFYETQDTYLIENGLHMSNRQEYPTDVDQTSNVPAIINLNWFNCFTQGNGAESYVIKDVFNKNFLSTNSRPNAVQLDGYKQVRNIASITYSGPFDKTTSYNSLNEFNLSRANYKDLDDKYGSIQKIHSRDTDLIVFQEDKVHRILYNKNVLFDAVGGGNVSSIEDVLGQEIPFAGEWGISKNPESFSYYANSIYFTDTNKGAVLRLGGDGLEPISKYKMRDWFKDNLSQYKNNFKYGGFDPIHDNYILSLASDKVDYTASLICGQAIQWLNIPSNSSYTYNIELGNNIGNHLVNYTIPGGSIFDFEMITNGVTTYLENATGTGNFIVPKTTTVSNGVLTIYNRENTMGSLSLKNVCVGNPELEVITLVVGDDSDTNKSMTNKYEWTNSATATSGRSSLLDVFAVGSVTRFNSDTGEEGENEIPYNNSVIKVTSTKATGQFTSCNRIGYVITANDLTPQQILDSATYPAITNSGDDNYIQFTFNRTGSQKLYLVWDYIDTENCDVEATPIRLCFNETDYALACDCDVVPVDCVVSDWGNWSACVGGTQSRTRTVITPSVGGGAACPSLTESRSCIPPIDCVVSEWSAWSACSDGFQTRTRTVTTPASGGGAACPTLTETRTCSSVAITNVICNDSDGGSTVTKRFRITIGNAPNNYTIAQGTVVNPAGLQYSIVATPGDSYIQISFKPSLPYGNEFSIELLLKNSSGNVVGTNVTQTLYGDYQSFLPSCTPVNCAVSEWSAWSACVDGVSTRTRTVTTEPNWLGTACPSLTETRSCTNCVVSEWSEWSDCIDGTKTRTRTVITPATGGGTECPALTETITCSGIDITDTICNTTGSGTVTKRFRIALNNAPSNYTIESAPQTVVNPAGLDYSIVSTPGDCYIQITFKPSLPYGNEFSIQLLLKNSSGNTVGISGSETMYGNYQSFLPSCFPVDCVVSNWSAWSNCDGGTQTRTRTIVTQPNSLGAQCPDLTETRDCPVDCVVSEWSAWSTCDAGTQTRTRTVITPALNGGAACPVLTESRDCAMDCVVSAWSDWSTCSEGTQTRTRTVVTPSMNGGAACPVLSETRGCSSINLGTVICNTQENNTVTKRFRITISNEPTTYTISSRNVQNYAGLQYSIVSTPGNAYLEVTFKPSITYGNEFSIELLLNNTSGFITGASGIQTVYGEYQSYLPACYPVNCVVSDWSAWSACTNGTQSRTRTIITQPNSLGTACPDLIETRDCPVDCVVSAWSDWSACNGGTKTRTRTVITPAMNGGVACPVLSETVNCPVDCVVSEWSAWSTCSDGLTTRTRTVVTPALNGGASCPVLSETVGCSTIGLTNTICNNESGSTVTKRFRIALSNEPSNYTITTGTVNNYAGLSYSIVATPGDSYLQVTFNPSITYGNELSIQLVLKNSSGVTVGTSSLQTVYGNYQSFLPSCFPVDCVVSNWSAWSTCVNGSQTRTRTVITQPQNGGASCPVLSETQSCAMPVDCVVSEWSEWSTCFDGFQSRTRTVVTPASGGGATCPTLIEYQECVTPVDCVVSGWSNWSTCSGGSQTRTRTVVTPASGGGAACPVLSETQSCTETPTCTSYIVGYSTASASAACSNYGMGTTISVGINALDWIDATFLHRSCGILAARGAGWYSADGTTRYWNGSAFTSSEVCIY